MNITCLSTTQILMLWNYAIYDINLKVYFMTFFNDNVFEVHGAKSFEKTWKSSKFIMCSGNFWYNIWRLWHNPKEMVLAVFPLQNWIILWFSFVRFQTQLMLMFKEANLHSPLINMCLCYYTKLTDILRWCT